MRGVHAHDERAIAALGKPQATDDGNSPHLRANQRPNVGGLQVLTRINVRASRVPNIPANGRPLDLLALVWPPVPVSA